MNCFSSLLIILIASNTFLNHAMEHEINQTPEWRKMMSTLLFIDDNSDHHIVAGGPASSADEKQLVNQAILQTELDEEKPENDARRKRAIKRQKKSDDYLYDGDYEYTQEDSSDSDPEQSKKANHWESLITTFKYNKSSSSITKSQERPLIPQVKSLEKRRRGRRGNPQKWDNLTAVFEINENKKKKKTN